MNPIPQPPGLMPWWVDLIVWGPVLLFTAYMVWMSRKAYSATGVLTKQSAFLDHQKTANEQALSQHKAMEELIARQYAEQNRRADEALAQSAEALRLQAATLEQLKAINAALSRAG